MTRMHAAALAILAAVIVGLPRPSEAILFCVSTDASGAIREGARIRLRTTCRAREKALPLSLEDGEATVRLTGVNLQIVDGAGSTQGTPNGRGNLLVGYDEGRCIEDGEVVGFCGADGACGNGVCDRSQKNGSHNLVVGPGHRYSSVGGFVAGETNSVTGAAASVAGGLENEARGVHASVAGGTGNTAAGLRSAVAGGAGNLAFAEAAAVGGGIGNAARAFGAVVAGGENNATNGFAAVVLGGMENNAADDHAVICGGAGLTTAGPFSVVCSTP
jgi:hypothetical protein